jgi:hypothetical protein
MYTSASQGRIIQGKLRKLLPGNGATHRERKEREGRKKGKGEDRRERGEKREEEQLKK